MLQLGGALVAAAAIVVVAIVISSGGGKKRGAPEGRAAGGERAAHGQQQSLPDRKDGNDHRAVRPSHQRPQEGDDNPRPRSVPRRQQTPAQDGWDAEAGRAPRTPTADA